MNIDRMSCVLFDSSSCESSQDTNDSNSYSECDIDYESSLDSNNSNETSDTDCDLPNSVMQAISSSSSGSISQTCLQSVSSCNSINESDLSFDDGSERDTTSPPTPTTECSILQIISNSPPPSRRLQGSKRRLKRSQSDQKQRKESLYIVSEIRSSSEDEQEVSCIDLTNEPDDVEVVTVKSGKKRKSKANNVVDITNSPSTSSNDEQSSAIQTDISQQIIKCPICLEEPSKFRVAGNRLVSTVCGHIFCDNCLRTALKKSRSCPKCRRRLTTRQFHPIFI